MNNNEAAQRFMNENRLTKCWECDGLFYKHEDNAKGRKLMTNKEIIEHSINAGVRTEQPAATEE